MHKMILLIAMSLISFNALASTDLSSEIIKNITAKHTENNHKSPAAMVYGGKDISRPIIATAN